MGFCLLVMTLRFSSVVSFAPHIRWVSTSMTLVSANSGSGLFLLQSVDAHRLPVAGFV